MRGSSQRHAWCACLMRESDLVPGWRAGRNGDGLGHCGSAAAIAVRAVLSTASPATCRTGVAVQRTHPTPWPRVCRRSARTACRESDPCRRTRCTLCSLHAGSGCQHASRAGCIQCPRMMRRSAVAARGHQWCPRAAARPSTHHHVLLRGCPCPTTNRAYSLPRHCHGAIEASVQLLQSGLQRHHRVLHALRVLRRLTSHTLLPQRARALQLQSTHPRGVVELERSTSELHVHVEVGLLVCASHLEIAPASRLVSELRGAGAAR